MQTIGNMTWTQCMLPPLSWSATLKTITKCDVLHCAEPHLCLCVCSTPVLWYCNEVADTKVVQAKGCEIASHAFTTPWAIGFVSVHMFLDRQKERGRRQYSVESGGSYWLSMQSITDSLWSCKFSFLSLASIHDRCISKVKCIWPVMQYLMSQPAQWSLSYSDDSSLQAEVRYF